MNDHGITRTIKNICNYKIYNVICYKSDPIRIHKKSYYLDNIGFIHVFTIEEYIILANTFITVIEIIEYLKFRQNILNSYPEKCKNINENY